MMRANKKNILFVCSIFAIVNMVGIYLTFFNQPREIKKKKNDIINLEQKYLDAQASDKELNELKVSAQEMDSMLTSIPKIIPVKFTEYDIYRDIVKVSKKFSSKTYMNLEYDKTENVKSVKLDLFSLKGEGEFNDVFRLIYELEKSRRLYKIRTIHLKDVVSTDESGKTQFLVSFDIKLEAYYTTDRNLLLNLHDSIFQPFTSIHNLFYPVIEPEIPPNTDHLFEVDGARLLALIPDGAFVVDKYGNSHTLMEGDQVYLGYLTRIDSDKKEVEFTLNKGGIVEKVTLKMRSSNK